MTDTVIEQIPTLPGMGRSLIHHDPRSRAFRARALVPKAQSEPRTKTWRRGQAYDQGSSSTCVAQTGKGVLNSSPLSSAVSYDRRSAYDTWDFYRGAQQRDEWPGESPTYEGTSGLGLCKYLTERGLIAEYRWCFGLQDTLLTLSHFGPVGIGVWWWNGMFDPDERGLIHPTGTKAGGHEVELIGVDVDREEVIGMNSWGETWGDRGRFRLSWFDLDMLLSDGGDAFVVVR